MSRRRVRLLAGSGTFGPYGTVPAGTTLTVDRLRRPDAELAADVSDALADDRALDGHDVSVTASDRVVTIEGTVRRIDDATHVRRLAWMMPCVVDVACQLTVAEVEPVHAPASLAGHGG
jgi:osmotically-inducible protein OsmY